MICTRAKLECTPGHSQVSINLLSFIWQMGESSNPVKVIVDGLTQDSFLEDKAGSSRPARVNAAKDSISLKFFMAKEGDGAAEQAVEPPIVFVEDSSILEASIQGSPRPTPPPPYFLFPLSSQRKVLKL